jgi:hypothetical protein
MIKTLDSFGGLDDIGEDVIGAMFDSHHNISFIQQPISQTMLMITYRLDTFPVKIGL